MTDDAKKSRTDLLKERQAARLERMRQGFATYWLTRSTRNGELTDYVDVWVARPTRTRMDDGDTFWMAANADGTGAHFGRWTVAQARLEVGNGVPEDDIQCLRNGPEPVVVPVELLPS